MSKIGFIGLGIMGLPMAKNLLAAGLDVTVWNRTKNKCDILVPCGAKIAPTPAELAKDCDIIITMLPDAPQVKEVVIDSGVLTSAKPGTLLVDMTSISPVASREIGAALLEKGIKMLDAPVSGGEPKAIDGTLAIMVGGDKEDYDRAKFLFDILGSSSCYIGPLGSGCVTKLANQIIVAGNIAALCEGLMLGEKFGIDPMTIYNAISNGLAGSTVMNAKSPMIAANNYNPGFKIDLHIKDLNNVMSAAQQSDSPTPITDVTLGMFKALHDAGYGQCDHSGIYKYYQMLTEETK